MASDPPMDKQAGAGGGPGVVRLFAGLTIAPFAWALQVLIGYGLAAYACYPTDAALGQPLWSHLRTFVGDGVRPAVDPVGRRLCGRVVELEGDAARVGCAAASDPALRRRALALHGAVRRRRERAVRDRAAVHERRHPLGARLRPVIDLADARTWICGSSGSTAPWTWDVHPVVATSLVVVSAIYAAGVIRLASEKRLPAAAKPRAAAFATGIAALAVVLTSPLDGWADVLFSAHMAQHLVLMMIAPPLLVLGHPIVVALWALPRDRRHAVGGWWSRSRVVRPIVDAIRSPLPAWLAASAALWFWHLPRPYAVAFDHAFAHGLEHLSFFVTSILFWRVVIEDPQSRRLSLGAAMLFVATFAMENAMLGGDPDRSRRTCCTSSTRASRRGVR